MKRLHGAKLKNTVLLGCSSLVAMQLYMRGRGKGWMKRRMDRTNGRDVSTLSSKINKFENLKLMFYSLSDLLV